MKSTRIPLVLALAVATAAPAREPENSGWTGVVPPTLENLVQSVGGLPMATASAPRQAPAMAPPSPQALPGMRTLTAPPVTPGGNAADEITPEIAEMARGLRYDPVMIYAFVRNHVDFVPYYGCKKGAHLTLLEMSGNDIDQSALLVSLLRASGHAPVYRAGAAAFSAAQHILWHGISTTPYGYLDDTQFAAAIGTTSGDPELYSYRMYYGLASYLGSFGYPIVQRVNAGGVLLYGIPHVWVELAVGGTTYELSPSFKQYNWSPGIDFFAAIGVTPGDLKSQLLADANPGGASDANGTTWVSDLKYAAIADRLTTYTANFNNHIRANLDHLGAGDLFPGKRLIQKPILTLADADPFVIYSDGWSAGATETWTSATIPPDRMSTLTVTAGAYSGGIFTTTLFNRPVALPALKGRKLSLAFAGNTATFRLDETAFGSAFTLPGATTAVRLTVDHDNYVWSYSGGIWTKTQTAKNDRKYVQTYTKGDTYAYAFPISYDSPAKLLGIRREILARHKRDNVPDTDWRVRTEVLNVIGLEWQTQTCQARRMAAALDGGITCFVHRLGRVAQEGSCYIDEFGDQSGGQHRGQNSAYSDDMLYGGSIIMSAMEHGVIEQLQGTGAVSTIKAIHKANGDKTPIYRATAANWPSVSPQLTGYPDLPAVASAVAAGATVLLPRNGDLTLGAWTGYAYAAEAPGLSEMNVSGLNGGYSVIPGPAGTSQLILWSLSDPSSDSSPGTPLVIPYTPTTTVRLASLEPVDLMSGAYFLDRQDLSLSGGGPRGLDFTRHYNSHLRHNSSAGLGCGWSHDSHARLVMRSSTRASLCGTSTYQAAPLAVAILAQGVMHFQHTTAKEWATAALIAKWGVDQMKYNAAAVTIGATTLEFVRMPGGSYVPPPGVAMTLVRNGDGSHTLTRRHGDTLDFDTAGKLTTVTDPSGNQKTLAYNGDRLATVTDSRGRTLTQTWTGDFITTVSDGTRTISFTYDNGDLVSATDPEGKTWTYQYDGDHRMIRLKDPDDRVITENTYDPRNRVRTQRSMGDPAREWQFTWSGFINVEENPRGGLTAYAYDERGRSVAVTNHLGHSTATAYDGQDRATHLRDAMGQSTYRTYDSDNNLILSEDELGYTTAYLHDAQLRPAIVIDKRDRQTTRTYNAAHQPLTVTDPLGHTVTSTYNADGALHTTTDAEGKTTTYQYDAWGNTSRITAHDGTFRTFTHNARGDLLTATDELGRVTAYTYNSRRQLLTITMPAVPGEPPAVVTHTYDNSGNPATTTDANGNTTTHTHNALGKALTTTLPALPTGNNILATGYDTRDWPVTTTNSLGHATTTGYDDARRPVTVTDPLGRQTATDFDANGRTIQATDPLSRVTKQTHNARGETIRATDALGKNTNTTHDPNGNPLILENRRSKAYAYTYDDANRLLTLTTPTGKTTATTYWNNNLVKTVAEPSGQTTTLAYNAKNLLSSKTDPAGAITYGYDNAGNLLTVTQGAQTVIRAYDERGRLGTYQNVDGDLIRYRYDANNNLTRLTYPDGKQVHYTYNARNLLETVTDWVGRTTSHQYDRLGRLAGITRPNGTACQMAYDAAGQLLERRETSGGKLISYLRFTYDAAGQTISRFRAPLVSSGWQHPALTATYDDDNRLATVNGQPVTVDHDGNLTDGPIPLPGSSSPVSCVFTYNSRNQLLAAAGVSYTYGPEGIRRTITDTTGTTRDIIDPRTQSLLVRHHPDGSKTRYVYGLGLLYEVDGVESTKTYHYDQVGSTILRTNGTGSVIGRAEYSAYGIRFWNQGDMATPFLYNGALGVQTDPNGLLNMRARYYSPYLMRFLNADPIGFSGGPNWFAYADGNPISKTDPFGLVAETLWDVANLGMGTYSLGSNVAEGNWGWAALDAAGLVYDGFATAVPFLPAGASAGWKAYRTGNTVMDSVRVGHDVAVVADKTHDAARTVDTTLDARRAGTQIHRQVADDVADQLWTLDSRFMRGANRASGRQPDLIGNNIWADITTAGEWTRHTRRYDSSFGQGIPLIYQRGVGITNSARLYSGVGMGIAAGKPLK